MAQAELDNVVSDQVAAIEVLDVSNISFEESAPHLWGSHIDAPAAGTESDLYMLRTLGWVLGRRARAVNVEVVYQGRVIRTDPLRGTRTDLPQVFPEIDENTESVFHVLVGVLGLTPEFELHLRVVLEDGTRAPIGSIRARHRPLRTDFTPRLNPIILTSLGRMGTTWLMRIFAVHPEVVVYPRYPYELSTAKYWAHMLKVLSEPANLLQSSDPVNFQYEPHFIGHNPFYDDQTVSDPTLGSWFGRTYVERLAAFCQQCIDDWYLTVGRAQGQERARYFAEKHMPVRIPDVMREIYPRAKEIFLIRDPRDMVCSVLQFDRNRGFLGFGRPQGRSDEEYVRRELRDRAVDLYESWKRRQATSHLIRYEDLVAAPAETIAAMLEYLDLDASERTLSPLLREASEETVDFRAHRTSASLEASVGRWRREGDRRIVKLGEEVFADLIEEFGYSEGERATRR